MSIKLPNCVYQKAFWIVIPILITATASGIAAIDAEINGLDDRLRDTEQQVAENNVPEIKDHLEDIDEKLYEIVKSQARIEAKLEK